MAEEEITLNGQQTAAVAAAVAWWREVQAIRRRDRHARLPRPVFVVAGLAGTGKTTLVKSIVKALNVVNVQYIGPTGKSAAVMRRKGNYGAITLHRFAFLCVGEHPNDRTGEDEVVFVARGTPETMAQLVVMDETSMVGGFEVDTLLAFGIPVIALGDHGQLEPVKARAGIDLENNADVTLTEIMRQEEESNIIRAAGFVRQGFNLPVREYSDVSVRDGYPSIEQLAEFAGLNGLHQIICARNDTRRDINNDVRSHLGFKGSMPKKGEKIVCRFNDHNRGIMNGEQFIVQETARLDPDGEDDVWIIRVKSLDDDRELTARFNPGCFLAKFGSDDYNKAAKSVGAWDFAYAVTCHTAQGSEWDEVMVIDEQITGVSRSRWRYTAITRAAKRLIFYR